MSDDVGSADISRPVFVCATANPGKVAEIRDILGQLVTLAPRPSDVPEVDEHADSLAGNARLKAIAIADATGRPALADDTGLEVDALDGRPGVHSARFAGPGCSDADNRRRLLEELARLDPGTPRSARFRTVVVVRWPDGRELVAEGECEGLIAEVERGEGGFGYDSVFVPVDGDGRTFAEMTPQDKHDRSHRGRALRALLAALDT